MAARARMVSTAVSRGRASCSTWARRLRALEVVRPAGIAGVEGEGLHGVALFGRQGVGYLGEEGVLGVQVNSEKPFRLPA
jgi:hypothetical protein